VITLFFVSPYLNYLILSSYFHVSFGVFLTSSCRSTSTATRSRRLRRRRRTTWRRTSVRRTTDDWRAPCSSWRSCSSSARRQGCWRPCCWSSLTRPRRAASSSTLPSRSPASTTPQTSSSTHRLWRPDFGQLYLRDSVEQLCFCIGLEQYDFGPDVEWNNNWSWSGDFGQLHPRSSQSRVISFWCWAETSDHVLGFRIIWRWFWCWDWTVDLALCPDCCRFSSSIVLSRVIWSLGVAV